MEVCVDCVQSAINAEKGGASRLELCSALSEGGLTPTPGLLKAVAEAVNIPIFCMLRVRGGNDFLYNEAELEAMKTDALLLRAIGKVDGFVFGALNSLGNIDVKACHQILQVTAPLPVTFHRAIDVCQDPIKAVDVIAELGFKRILTSGQKETALEGIPMIRRMVEQAGNQITIMVGAGVKKENIAHILLETGATAYHGSAKAPPMEQVGSPRPGRPGFNGPSDKSNSYLTDADEVSEIVRAAQSVLLK